jgi:hypothetical protein
MKRDKAEFEPKHTPMAYALQDDASLSDLTLTMQQTHCRFDSAQRTAKKEPAHGMGKVLRKNE